jgi:hypothetical protein
MFFVGKTNVALQNQQDSEAAREGGKAERDR